MLALVRELAAFENLKHEVTATEADLARLLGDEGHTLRALLAWEGEVAVGLAVYYETYSTFVGKTGIYLEDIFVKPDCRGRGIGRALLGAVAREASERDCARLEWQALDWNVDAHRFYESIGATKLSQWLPFRMETAAIRKFPLR